MNNRSQMIKQFGATVFFVLLFLCVLPYVKRAAAAEGTKEQTVAESDVVVDYNNEIITVRANDSTELYYGFASAGKTPKEYLKIGPELIAEYQYGDSRYDAFYIDLSAQSFKSGTMFYVKYAEDDEVLKLTMAERVPLKVVYKGVLPENETGVSYANAYALKINGRALYRYFNADTGYFTFLRDGEDYTALSNVEWRAGTAMNFQELSELNPELYQKNGSSLYFRINSGDEPISKEAKLRVSKPAKAPSVKVDGNKLTIAVKDTQEYRLELEDGTLTDWTAVEEGTKQLAISSLNDGIGDGISVPFDKMKIQVRNAASEKKAPSYITDVYIDETEFPKSGEGGLSIDRVNPADITKGICITNHSEQDYMVAIIDSNAWECNGNVAQLIQKINYSAKKDETGYLQWKTVKAGAKATISYSSFKEFEDSYTVLSRIASVKEDKKTSVRDFRLASVVRPVGGVLPTADLKSQAFLVEEDADLQRTVHFVEVEGYTLYTSVDGAAYVKNTEWKLDITGKVGKSMLVKAYLVETASGLESDIVTYRYCFMADGELPAYANDWGYIQCKLNGWALAYQRAYLAATSYEESFSIDGLGMEVDEIMQVIKMMRLDNPEIIQLGNSYTLRNGTEMILPLGNPDEMNALLIECQETAQAALKAIEAKYDRELTKIEYVKEIYDYIVLEKQYKSSAMDQTMAGILSDAYTPVCTSYALTFHYMCELAGIQTVVVHGNATNSKGKTESHVWNMVNLGDTVDYSAMKTVNNKEIDPNDWYEIDVTWGDPVGADEDYIGYTYFNLTTDEMTEHSSGTKHVRSTGEAYDSYPVEKCTGTAYNYDYLVKNNYLTAQ